MAAHPYDDGDRTLGISVERWYGDETVCLELSNGATMAHLTSGLGAGRGQGSGCAHSRPERRRMPEGKWTSAYMRHHSDASATHDTLEGAVNFLRYGEEEGDHSARSITGPDGTVVWSRESGEDIWEFAERMGITGWWDANA